MLTPSATRFVGPLTFRALSRHPVETDVLDLLPDQRIGHIVIADTADAIVVAPATARWLGAMAGGIADDAVLAACLATERAGRGRAGDGRRHVDAPSDADQRRAPPARVRLSGRRARGRPAGVGPVRHWPARRAPRHRRCRGRGRRRLPVRQPDADARPPIADRLGALDLEGRRIVVTAGGTAEPIDPVRFIGNRSTGKMGLAIARRRSDAGRAVTLVAGRLEVPVPPGIAVVSAPRSTSAMRDAVLEAVFDDGADALVMAAAVADFRPTSAATTKLTRDASLTLELEPTEDILAEVGSRGPRAGSPPGHRRVRGRDGLARSGPGQAAPERRRPARGQRRRGGRLGVRDRYQPGLHPERRRLARRSSVADEGRGRRPAAGSGRPAVGRTRGTGRRLGRPSTESRP